MLKPNALLTAMLFCCANGLASEPATTSLDFEQAARLALSENADLQTLRYQEDSQSLRAAQQLSPNSPVLNLVYNDLRPGGSLTNAAQTIYSLNWTLGFPGKALSQSAASRHVAEALHEQTVAKELDILAALSNTYASLSANERTFAFLVDEERKAGDLVKLLEKKYTAGQAAQVDLLNQRVVVAQLQQALLANRNDRANLHIQFLNLIRKPGSKEFVPVIPKEIEIPPLSRSHDELVQLMLRNRHALLASQKQVEAAEAQHNAAILAPFPDFQLLGAVNNYAAPDIAPNPGVGRDYSVGLGISLPIFFPFNELTGLRAAAKDRNAAESARESQRLQALADLESLYTSFNSSQKELENLKTLVLPAAKASYDLTALTYSLGKADYFSLNASRGTWIQSEKDLINKKASLAQLFNQIMQQVGCDVTQKEGPYACK